MSRRDDSAAYFRPVNAGKQRQVHWKQMTNVARSWLRSWRRWISGDGGHRDQTTTTSSHQLYP